MTARRPGWVTTEAPAIVAEMMPEATDDHQGYVFWNFTGYPTFFDDPVESWPAQLRVQIQTYLDAEASGPEAVERLLTRCSGELEGLPAVRRREYLLGWLRSRHREGADPVTTRDVEAELGIKRVTAASDLVNLEAQGLAKRMGTGEHAHPTKHHQRGRWSLLWAFNDCNHKFVDSTNCLKCGWTPPRKER